jgi:hypothetical protein
MKRLVTRVECVCRVRRAWDNIIMDPDILTPRGRAVIRINRSRNRAWCSWSSRSCPLLPLRCRAARAGWARLPPAPANHAHDDHQRPPANDDAEEGGDRHLEARRLKEDLERDEHEHL